MNTFVSNENFSITYDIYGGEVFLHCDVYNFSPRIFKVIKAHFLEFCATLIELGKDSVYAYTQNLKFCSKLKDFYNLGVIYKNDQKFNVIEWRLI